MLRLILILSCVLLGVLSATFSPKCKLDRDCITKHVQEVYMSLVEDVNNKLDPFYQELIQVDLETIKYTLTNTTTTGHKKCSVKNANLDFKKNICEINFYCPEYHTEGKYEVHGSLLDRPVEGNGEFTVDTKAYDFIIQMDVSVTPKGDKHYIHINNFHVDATTTGNLVYNFKNLYYGHKETSDELLKIINENSRAVAKELQGRLFMSKYKKTVECANIILERLPLEYFFIF